MNECIAWDYDGTVLCLLRSDQGDGGWSLHTREQIEDAEAHDDVPEVLLSGPADWDDEAEFWNRPNAADIAAALEKAKA